MNYREALKALAVNARIRQQNCQGTIGKFGDDAALESTGAAWAFGVMADELEWLADPRNRNAAASIKAMVEGL